MDERGKIVHSGDREALCRLIEREFSFQFDGNTPCGVITWLDSEFSVDQWRRIENRLHALYRRSRQQRQLAEGRESCRE